MNNYPQHDDTLIELSDPINFSRIIPNRVYDYKLNKDQDWVRELLLELSEKVSLMTEKMKLDQGFLTIELKLQKKYKQDYGQFLLCEGKIHTEFFTECVKTLATMKDHLEVEFRSVFLDQSCEELPEFKDQDEAYFDQNLYDIFYFERNRIPIKDMLHEVIYLNINSYPTRA